MLKTILLSSVLLFPLAAHGAPPGLADAAPVPIVAADPPAAPDGLAPRLTATEEALLLSWLEPVPGEDGVHRLRFSRWTEAAGGWSDPVTIRQGEGFFANWADVPGVAREGDGTLVAWWLQKLGEGTYAYGIRLARSGNGGGTWEETTWLHDDTSPTEHGFASLVPEGDGLRAFWLDGRAMEEGEDHGGAGAMTLRVTRVREGRPAASVLVDERTCECCDTDAALSSAGPLVVYRDRSAKEVRDVAIASPDAGRLPPALVHEDGWEIAGCPVNGPAIVADGPRVAVAWFTAADERSRVLVAFSVDGGKTFGTSLVVDDDRPVGRVALAPGAGGVVWLSWIGRTATGGELRIARIGAAGEVEKVVSVAQTSAERSAGVPSLASFAGAPWVAWVDEPFAEPARIRVGRIVE